MMTLKKSSACLRTVTECGITASGVCVTEYCQHYRQCGGTGLYQLACQRDLLLALLQRVWLYGQNFREGDTFHPGSGYFHLYGTGW
ncbi:hypothetical protein ABR759_00210 [Escherichia coli]